ncbi:MAG: hypothetical protein JWM68_4717 [Verrucomicrobiales bacterium]|nr:hypothetical protein [Verrucomicrobiales bacterium]
MMVCPRFRNRKIPFGCAKDISGSRRRACGHFPAVQEAVIGLVAVGREFGKQNGNSWSKISILGSKSSPFGHLELFMEAKCREMTKLK